MRRFFVLLITCIIPIGALFSGCSGTDSKNPPELQLFTEGNFTATFDEKTYTGQFVLNGPTCIITISALFSSDIQLFFDGEIYQVAFRELSFSAFPDHFSKNSFIQELPVLLETLSSGNFQLVNQKDYWNTEIRTEDDIVKLHMDHSGKIFHLAFPNRNGIVQLHYPEKTSNSSHTIV